MTATAIQSIIVTGMSFRQPTLTELALHLASLTNVRARLRPEPDNEYDADATAVDIEGAHVAYLPRMWRETFNEEMKAACVRLLAGEGVAFADLVRYADDAGESRWTVRLYGEFKDAH